MEDITLNALRHYVYCPHEWGLMFIGGEWRENGSTVAGHLFHERVHNTEKDESRTGKVTVRGLPLYEETLGLVGIADLVEFGTSTDSDAYVLANGRRVRPTVVEYKVGRPPEGQSITPADRMQLTAQMVCLETMLGCRCEGALYYRRINRRVRLTDFDCAKKELLTILEEMRGYLEQQKVPEKRAGVRCNACSLKDVCLPKTTDRNIFDVMEKIWRSQS